MVSEKSNVSWQSLIFGVPKGVMSFAMRSATNILATPDNLRRWKKVRSDSCKMCANLSGTPNKGTLCHILNSCPAFLGEKERYTWRHNSVLTYIAECLKDSSKENLEIYADIPGHSLNGTTIPPSIAVTASRPDLVVIDNTEKSVYLFELTVCFESEKNIDAAHNRKYERYSGLAEDIKENGYKCYNIPFEIGSRGHLTTKNRCTLATMHSLCKPSSNFKTFLRNVTKTSLVCSYSIYLSKDDTWLEVPPLKP